MSHLTCPKCGSTKHTTGYGYAGGGLATYTFCDGCETLLEHFPDVEGLDDEKAKEIKAKSKAYMDNLWKNQ